MRVHLKPVQLEEEYSESHIRAFINTSRNPFNPFCIFAFCAFYPPVWPVISFSLEWMEQLHYAVKMCTGALCD